MCSNTSNDRYDNIRTTAFTFARACVDMKCVWDICSMTSIVLSDVTHSNNMIMVTQTYLCIMMFQVGSIVFLCRNISDGILRYYLVSTVAMITVLTIDIDAWVAILLNTNTPMISKQRSIVVVAMATLSMICIVWTWMMEKFIFPMVRSMMT